MDGRMEKNKQRDEIAEALLRKAGFRVLEPEMYALYIIISPLYIFYVPCLYIIIIRVQIKIKI